LATENPPGEADSVPAEIWALNEEELNSWGRAIGSSVVPPVLITIEGDLGAGKTTLARAIARGAGVEGPIPSPTYNLMFRYAGARGLELVHLDLYRLEKAHDVWGLGWADLPEKDELVIVEWPERAAEYLPSSYWRISLGPGDDDTLRSVRVTRTGYPSPIPLPAD
jgi:tRNA threonylcarbamoyladenosine biosynthesis protein TsaE